METILNYAPSDFSFQYKILRDKRPRDRIVSMPTRNVTETHRAGNGTKERLSWLQGAGGHSALFTAPHELAPPALRHMLPSLGKCKVPSSPRQRRDPDTRKPENQRLSHDALVTEPDLTDLDLFWS